MRKLYIVHSDPEDFKILMESARLVGNTHALDYDLSIRRQIAAFLGDQTVAYIPSKEIDRVISEISKCAIRYNDRFYVTLIQWLSLWSGYRERVFVRLEDTKLINRLKRKYKRPNYMTIMLTKVPSPLTTKFDIVIRTDDKLLFKIEMQKFVKTKLFSLNFIDLKKLKP